MRIRGTTGLDPLAADASQSAASGTLRGLPWPGAMRSSSLKRQRCAPLGLMVVEPDYVEGFLPATSRRKRPRRPTAAAPLKLQPLALALPSAGSSDRYLTDNRRREKEPGTGHPFFHQKVQRTPFGHDDGDSNSRVGCGARHKNYVVTSPSLDVLTRDGQDGSHAMVRNPAVVDASASAPRADDEGCRGWMAGAKTSGRRHGEGSRERERAQNTEAREAKPQRSRDGTTAKQQNGLTQTSDNVAGNRCPRGRLLTSEVRHTTEDTLSGDALRYRDAILPLALPGEACNASFGAAAKAVVLVSGSSRLMVSRHVRGRRLLSRVELPWSPPLQPPWRDSNRGNPNRRRSRQQKKQEQLWELHHAALQIQRVWRGYTARVQFWTDGGVGLHAVATRIQRVFRGWRGKIRACKMLVEKRARAAAVITALGRGFQGRKEARRLRVAWHNAAAAKIQGHYRARAARRWMEQLAIAAAIRRARQIQAVWRGNMARKRFRVLGLRLSLEEDALKEICFKYTGRKGWAGNQKSTWEKKSVAPNMATPMPALPEGFLSRFDCCRSGKGGASINVGDELAAHTERSVAHAGSRDRQRAPAERLFVSDGAASTSGSISAGHSDVGGGLESVFGGAFASATFSSRDEDSLKAHAADVDAADSATLVRGNDAHAVITTPKSELPAAESPTSPPESYFIAYGHCLLAGAGTGAGDEAAEAATAGSQSVAGDFGGVNGRARVSKKKRARGYGDALEVFQEGLRRFPTSVMLLYGASLAMQATWFTDGRGDSPTAAMLEASLCLLGRAWAQDPNRRAYQQAEAFFLAAARIARRRLRRAEAAAAAAREAALDESRAAKELNASDRVVGRVFAERLLGGVVRETKHEDAVDEQEQGTVPDGFQEEEDHEEQDEPEEVTVCKKAAAVATLHVALWSQIANGNHDMDLRRAETVAAYRRAGRLYARAALLDSGFAVPEVRASERIFAALYRNKHKLVMTRPLRLRLPPHPEQAPLEKLESAEIDVKGEQLLGLLDPTVDPAEESRQLPQKQSVQVRQEHQKQETQKQQQLEEERRLQLRYQEQQREKGEQEQRRQLQLIESTLANTPLMTTASATSSPKRPHAIQRMASKVVAAVREGTKIIMRRSPRSSSRSTRGAGLGIPAAEPVDGMPRDHFVATRGGEDGSRGPIGGEEVEECPADSSADTASGTLWKGPAPTATIDRTDSHPASFHPMQKPHEKQQEQQQGQRHHQPLKQDAAATGSIRWASRVTTASGSAKSTNKNSGPETKPAVSQEKSLRVTVTAWRCGANLVLRVTERDVPESAAACAGPQGSAEGSAPMYQDGLGEVKPPQTLLGEGGSIVVVHEAEMERLVVAAIEEQVADGRPRNIFKAKESFKLVCEYFMGKMVLLPEFDKDPRYRFSTSRTIGGRTGGFAVGLGRFAAGLPYLDAMRAQQAEASARDDGARVLQRAFGGLLARSKCRLVCYQLLQVMEDIRQQDRRLLEEDVLRQKESDAARCIQGAWKGWKLRVRLSQLKSAAKLVRRCFRRLEAKRAAEKAERKRLEGPEVLTVYHRGAVVSGVPLMLSVLRCGNSYKFVGRDQEACWAHHGYCYEFEVVSILQQHNLKYRRAHKGDTFMSGRVGPVDTSRSKEVVEMLVSRLALVDALCASTAELRGQHRYKTLVVQTTDLALVHREGSFLPSGESGTVNSNRAANDQKGLRGPGIMAVGAEHGRGLRDTRALVAKSLKRYQKRQAKWEETRRKQAYMEHHKKMNAAAQD